MKKMKYLLVASLGLSPLAGYAAGDFSKEIPMWDKGAATYYVNGKIEGLGKTEFMVDTGSGYMTINEHTLAILKKENRATYVKDLVGILADGRKKVVPVYKITSVNIGGECEIRDVEAAVFPGKTRQILGLSALQKTSPFIFSMDPPQLTLSNCDAPKLADAGVTKTGE